MKKNILVGLFVMVMALPGLCRAEKLYGGIQYGTLSADDADTGNIGLFVGNKVNESFSIEALYTFTINEDSDGVIDFSTDTIGLFAAFKSEGNVYGKGKIGFSNVTYEVEGFGVTISDDTSGLAFGIGFGVKTEGGAVEFEYTILPDFDTLFGTPVNVSNDFLSVGYVASF